MSVLNDVDSRLKNDQKAVTLGIFYHNRKERECGCWAWSSDL